MYYFLLGANIFIFSYFVLVQSYYLIMLVFAIPELFQRYKEVEQESFESILKSDSVPQISIIVPTYNEASSILFIINSLLRISYRYKEIVVVNDGSIDNTMQMLKEYFKLIPIPPLIPPALKTKKVHNYYRSQKYHNLLVVDKENGSKIDANNAGINACTSDYYVVIDADTIITEDALQRLIKPFFMNPNVIAAGGSLGIANGCELKDNRIVKINFPSKPILGIQVIEYLRAFLMARQGWNKLGGCLVISGAFGLFDKKRVIEVGGYTRVIGDDVDLVIRLHKLMLERDRKYSIQIIPDLVALTQAPFTWRSLGHQRERWQRGIISAMWDNREMCFNPDYKKVGLFGYSFFLVTEVLSPLGELFGYFIVVLSLFFGVINWYAAMWFLLLALAFPVVLTTVVIFMQSVSFRWYNSFKDYLKMIGCSILEQLGYRQYLVLYRALAFIKWLKKEEKWKAVTRTSFKQKN